MAYPEWVEKYRKKGTNISCIRGKYYLYACTSKYDPEKKRAKKITGEYLGRITEEGLIPPKRKQVEISDKEVSIKEYGASKVVSELGSDIYAMLKKHFPKDADRLFVLSALRLFEKSPFKRIGEAYTNSYLSEQYGKFDFMLLDLGVNMEHFKDGERGFSIKYDAPLDMRFNRTNEVSAETIVNTYSLEKLSDLFSLYGDFSEKTAEYLAKGIIEERKKKKITTT